MGRLATGLLGLVLVSACSFAHTRTPITASTPNPSCSNNRARVDAIVGTSLLVGGLLVGSVIAADSEDPLENLLLGTAIAGTGAAFLASAVHGWRDDERCERELVAAQANPFQEGGEPLHAEAATADMTCEQRRLDMYTRAVTGADHVQRVRLLTQLPSCEERTERERAWVLTRMASLDASAGRCDNIEAIARQVYELDVVLHDVVMMGDIEIKHCLIRQAPEL